MAEPVSITAVSAAAASSVATGASGGAAAAGTAAGTGAVAGAGATAGSAGGAAAGAGTTGSAAAGTAGGSAAAAAGAQAGASTSLGAPATGGSGVTGIANVAFKVVDTGREVPAEPFDPSALPSGFRGEVINMPGSEFKAVRETVESRLRSQATAAQRADSARPQQVRPGQPSTAQKPEVEQSRPADPTPGLRSVGEKLQRGPDPRDAIDRDRAQRRPGDETTQPQRAVQEEPDGAYLRSRRPRELGPPPPDEPHERERRRLDAEMGRYHEMTRQEQRDLTVRLDVWLWRDKEKYPDETPVIGPHGHMGRDAYAKKKRRVESRQNLADQLDLGRAIAEGNPLSSAVGLKIYAETGDPIAAAQGTDALSGLTGGGKGRKGRRARQSRQRRTRAKRQTARGDRKRSGVDGRKGSGKGKPQKKKVRSRTPIVPRQKLTRRQRYYQREVQRLADQLPKARQPFVTVAILVVERAGRREVWISTSLEKPPPQIEKAARRGHRLLRGTKSDPRNKDLPRGEKLTYHHAEHDGVSIALSSGYKVIEVYPSRPACTKCSEFRSLGYTIIDPP